jgi:hypothetical protein
MAQFSFIPFQVWILLPLTAATLSSTVTILFFSTHQRHSTIQTARDTIFHQKLRLKTPINLSTNRDFLIQKYSRMFGLAIRIQAGPTSLLCQILFSTCAILPSTWDLVAFLPIRHLVNILKALLTP